MLVYYTDVTWTFMFLKAPTERLFVQQLGQANSTKKPKLRITEEVHQRLVVSPHKWANNADTLLSYDVTCKLFPFVGQSGIEVLAWSVLRLMAIKAWIYKSIYTKLWDVITQPFVKFSRPLKALMNNYIPKKPMPMIDGHRLRTIQYIPRNMHTVLLCFALLWLCNRS